MNFFTKYLKIEIIYPFIIEFHLIAIPILFSLIMNQYILILIGILIILIIIENFLYFAQNNEWLLSASNIYNKPHFINQNNVIHFNFVSKYRSLLQIATCITILAVDFHFFPRKFCKVEEEGVSLMDCGTGSALFSLALVSRQLREKNQKILFRLYRAVSSCLPLLLIGILRMLMIKKTDYQVFKIFLIILIFILHIIVFRKLQ